MAKFLNTVLVSRPCARIHLLARNFRARSEISDEVLKQALDTGYLNAGVAAWSSMVVSVIESDSAKGCMGGRLS